MKAIELITGIFRLPARIAGADFRQFAAILRIRLMLDGRIEYMPGGNKKSRTFIYQLGILFFFGLLFGILIFYSKLPFATIMVLFFASLMFITGMTLITEYTTVLFDRRDNHIILPRPVSRRTLLFSRIVHIQIYSGIITIGFSLVTLFAVAIKYNIAVFFIFLLSIILLSWLTLWTTIIFYLFVSRIFKREKFKDIINYLQIIMAIVFTLAYQVIGRIHSFRFLEEIDFQSWLSYVIPPFWFAELIDYARRGFIGLNVHDGVVIMAGLVIPVLCAALLVRFLASEYDRVLASFDAESPGEVTASVLTRAAGFIRDVSCTSFAEKAGWNLVMACTDRDRKFKSNVYPGLFVMIFFGVLLLFPEFIKDSGQPIKNGYIAGVIISAISGLIVFKQIVYTESPKAAWVYSALPLSHRGQVITGCIKAVFVKFYLPVHIILLAGLIIFTPSRTIYALQAIAGSYLLTLIMIYFQKDELPFSRSYEMIEKGGITVTAIVSILFAIVLGGIVYLTTLMPLWITLAVTGLYILFSALMLRYLGKSVQFYMA